MTLTPFQPVGPYFHVMLGQSPRGADVLVTDRCPGRHITIAGVVSDGNGAPVTDGLVEIWQADTEGRYRHPDDPRSNDVDSAFRGHGRAATDEDGRFRFVTVKPGAVPGSDRRMQAPHVLVSILAPGILTRFITRIYFADEAANETDPILALVPADRRHTLVAVKTDEANYHFDIVLQGQGETVFFDA